MTTSSKHHRRSIRLPGYDYTQPGAYFITICTFHHKYLFGEVVAGEMRQNEFGGIVQTCWDEIPVHFLHTELDAFVVMPNHIHGIILITDAVGARHAVPLHGNAASPHGNAVPPQQTERFGKPVPGSIPTIVRSFKSAVTRRINQLRDTQGTPVWQRNYFEHIVRNEHTLNAIRQYILNNPHRWPLDRYNPDASGPDPKAQDIWATLRREQAGESKL